MLLLLLLATTAVIASATQVYSPASDCRAQSM